MLPPRGGSAAAVAAAAGRKGTGQGASECLVGRKGPPWVGGEACVFMQPCHEDLAPAPVTFPPLLRPPAIADSAARTAFRAAGAANAAAAAAHEVHLPTVPPRLAWQAAATTSEQQQPPPSQRPPLPQLQQQQQQQQQGSGRVQQASKQKHQPERMEPGRVQPDKAQKQSQAQQQQQVAGSPAVVPNGMWPGRVKLYVVISLSAPCSLPRHTHRPAPPSHACSHCRPASQRSLPQHRNPTQRPQAPTQQQQ